MFNNTEVHLIEYTKASIPLRKEFAELIKTVWPESLDNDDIHHPDLLPVSFFLRVAGLVISYCAVLSKEISHADNTYKIAGLSYVCTHPNHRKQGYGLQTVKIATQFIENSHIDIGLFTCDYELVSFYKNFGWSVANRVSVVSGKYPGSLSSFDLGKEVLIRFFSKKSIIDKKHFSNTVIYLDLPLGNFW